MHHYAEAERCYRKSLIIDEKLSNTAGVASSYRRLAALAWHAGHPDEAEGWYKRALELQEQVQRGDLSHAHCLSDLATLVVSEVGKGHASKARLTEAKNYSQQSLTFMEQLDTSLVHGRANGYVVS